MKWKKNKLSGFDIVQVCPKCKKEFVGYPTLSRVDNKTEVCSECGVREALEKVFEVINYDLYIIIESLILLAILINLSL